MLRPQRPDASFENFWQMHLSRNRKDKTANDDDDNDDDDQCDQ